jgi:hypothetical protein
MDVKFHSKIYNKNIIQRAVRDFEGLADFEVNKDNDYFIIKISRIDPDVSDRFYEEFNNYVLCLQKKNPIL